MEYDYIIVGFGLAGLAFAQVLTQNNKSFIVFDNNSQQSSLVAGGTYNPLVLKRFTPVWNGDKQLELAKPFYKELEKRFLKQFDTVLTTHKLFTSNGDQNNWFIASDKPTLAKYMDPRIYHSSIEGVKSGFGYGKLSGTGWIDIKSLISSFKDYLIASNQFSLEAFDYSELVSEKAAITYKNYKAKKIVFAEGYGLKQNDYFNYLPLNGTKGETIIIHAPDLKINFQLKSAVFVLPLGNDLYRVGATFNWSDKTSLPTEEGKHELIEKLEKVIDVSYKVVDQSAGIRPTVKDRRPLVGSHPDYQNIYVLNGLGTRGVMIAPTIANMLFNHIEYGFDLDKEVDIKRFES